MLEEKNATKNSNIWGFARLFTSLVAIVILAWKDISCPTESVPTAVYVLIGGLNGADAYKLLREVNNKG